MSHYSIFICVEHNYKQAINEPKTAGHNKTILNPTNYDIITIAGAKMKQTKKIINQAKSEGRKALLETEAKNICTEYSIPVTKFGLAHSKQEAASLAEEIGFPVVLKIVSPDIVHKTDAGGVLVNLKTKSEVASGYAKIIKNVKKHKANAKVVGVLVQEMAPQSTEVIVGAIKDPQFGQTLMFGLGGIFVELLKDVSFRVTPLTAEDAREMITRLKAYPLLSGYRNTPPADIDALAKILCNTSRLVLENPEIKELDLNPIMAYEKGAKTVDARIILE